MDSSNLHAKIHSGSNRDLLRNLASSLMLTVTKGGSSFAFLIES